MTTLMIVPVLLCLLYVRGVFTSHPDVEAICNTDSVSLSISPVTDGSFIFIPDFCPVPVTITGVTTFTHTYDESNCNTYPPLGTEFILFYIQNNVVGGIASGRYAITCNMNTGNQQVVFSSSITGNIINGSPDVTDFKPTLTVAVQDGNGNVATVANFGQPLALVVSASPIYNIKIQKLAVNDVVILDNGCILNKNFAGKTVSVPATAPDPSEVKINFPAFIFYHPTETGVESSNELEFTVDVGFCENTCADPSCSGFKRRRRAADDDVKNITRLKTGVTVYSKEEFERLVEKEKTQAEEESSNLPMTATLAALGLAVVLCLALATVLFVKMRSYRKNKRADEMFARQNAGFKH